MYRKAKKYDAIKLLAYRKFDSIADIISQAMQDKDIPSIELHKVLQEVENYRKLKADIRNQAKVKVRQITKKQREEFLEQGKKEGKEDSLQKIASTSGIQGVNTTYSMKLLNLTAYDFMVYKDYKISLKFLFATTIINSRNRT